MLSCSIWFPAPSFWIGGGLESRRIGHVYGADGAVWHYPEHCSEVLTSHVKSPSNICSDNLENVLLQAILNQHLIWSWWLLRNNIFL